MRRPFLMLTAAVLCLLAVGAVGLLFQVPLAAQPVAPPGASQAQAAEGQPPGDSSDADALHDRIRDLRAEVLQLREQLEGLEARTIARVSADALRLARQEIAALETALTVSVGPCTSERLGTVRRAPSAGFVVAALDTGPSGDDAPRSGVVGFVAPDRESLEQRPISRRHMRGGASVRYANIEAYLIHGSLTMPIGEGEFWTVLNSYGTSPVNSEIRFCPLQITR